MSVLSDCLTALNLIKSLWETRDKLRVNKKELQGLIAETQKFKDILQRYADDPSLMTGSVATAISGFNTLVDEINKYVQKYSATTITNQIGKLFSTNSRAKEIANFYLALSRHMTFFCTVQGLDSETRRIGDVSEIVCSVEELMAEMRANGSEASGTIEELERHIEEYNTILLLEVSRIREQQQSLSTEQFSVLQQDSALLRDYLHGVVRDISTDLAALSRGMDQKHAEVMHEQILANRKLDHVVDGASHLAERIDYAIEGGEGNDDMVDVFDNYEFHDYNP